MIRTIRLFLDHTRKGAKFRDLIKQALGLKEDLKPEPEPELIIVPPEGPIVCKLSRCLRPIKCHEAGKALCSW